jgi:hypothetical protein
MKIAFLILLIFYGVAFGQTNTAPSPTTDSTEIAILKAQLQTMQTSDQRLLTSVYWSLGIVGGVALLLVGYSWFTNMRIYERDKAALTQDLEGQLESKFSSLKSAFETKQAELNKAILESATTPLAKLEKQMAEQMASLKANINTRCEQTGSSLHALDLRVEYDREQAEAYYWEFRQVPGNEIDRYESMLTYAIAMGAENKIARCLARIEKLMSSGTLPYWGRVPGILETLDKLPPKYSTQADAVREHLKKVKE